MGGGENSCAACPCNHLGGGGGGLSLCFSSFVVRPFGRARGGVVPIAAGYGERRSFDDKVQLGASLCACRPMFLVAFPPPSLHRLPSPSPPPLSRGNAYCTLKGKAFPIHGDNFRFASWNEHGKDSLGRKVDAKGEILIHPEPLNLGTLDKIKVSSGPAGVGVGGCCCCWWCRWLLPLLLLQRV